MTIDIIENMHGEQQELYNYLVRENQISFSSAVDEVQKKLLILSIASFFEQQVTEIIKNMATRAGSTNSHLLNFVKNKAINRQYHSYFQWDGNNANHFFGLFGEDFRKSAKEDVKNDDNLKEAIRNFLELGLLRNNMVHNDFVRFYLEKTSDEIFSMYLSARQFIVYLSDKLSR